MGARYPYYLLADSPAGQLKEAEITRSAPSSQPTRGDIRHGFVYERVPHITLKSIANNAEIDVIWDKWQETLEPLREELNAAMGKTWEEWEIPRVAEHLWPAEPLRRLQGASSRAGKGCEDASPAKIDDALKADQQGPRTRLQHRDAAGSPGRPLARTGRHAARRLVEGPHRSPTGDRRLDRGQGRLEYLYDKPYDRQEDRPRRRTVHGGEPVATPCARCRRERRTDRPATRRHGHAGYGDTPSFPRMILENLKTAGVQQAHKEDKITFTSLTAWPGDLSAPKAATSKARRRGAAPRSVPPSSSAPSSAPSPVRTW
jgi:adenine-specific DNA-methyltransferase